MADVAGKVRRMLALGLLMLFGALVSFGAGFEPALLLGPISFVGIVAYEAWRYRYWRIYSELAVATIVLAVALYFV